MVARQRDAVNSIESPLWTREELRPLSKNACDLSGLGETGADGRARLVLDAVINCYGERRKLGRPASGQAFDPSLPACWPSADQLAARLHCSPKTVYRALERLEGCQPPLVQRVKWVLGKPTTDLLVLTFAGRRLAILEEPVDILSAEAGRSVQPCVDKMSTQIRYLDRKEEENQLPMVVERITREQNRSRVHMGATTTLDSEILEGFQEEFGREPDANLLKRLAHFDRKFGRDILLHSFIHTAPLEAGNIRSLGSYLYQVCEDLRQNGCALHDFGDHDFVYSGQA